MSRKEAIAGDQCELVLRKPHKRFMQPSGIAHALLVCATHMAKLLVYNVTVARNGEDPIMQFQEASQALNVRRKPHIVVI